MKKLHFNSLPDFSRRRLSDCLAGSAQPPPLFKIRSAKRRYWIFLLVLGLGICGITWATNLDAGPVDSILIVPFLLGTCFVVAGVLGLVRVAKVKRALPFPPGLYIYPMELIDATRPVLHLHPLGELKGFSATHHHYNGIYTATRFYLRFPRKSVYFSMYGKQKADKLLERIHTSRFALGMAIKTGDWDSVATMDPLFEARAADEWNKLEVSPPVLPRDATPQAFDIPWLFKSRFTVWLATLLLSFPIAFALRAANNSVRDDAAFLHARSQDSVAAYQRYLVNGTDHADEVRTTLLPTAMFALAERFRSVAKFRLFIGSYPTHPRATEARERIHAFYESALANTLERADASAHGFLRTLFAYLESHDSPPLHVRFGRPSSESLDAIDTVLKQSGNTIDNLPVAPISPSFTEQRCIARESQIYTKLDSGFKSIVSNEILSLSQGPRLPSGETTFGRPTVGIHYTIAPSGASYIDDNHTRAYVGIIVKFDLELIVPDAGPPLHLTFDVTPAQHFEVRTRDTRMHDNNVYDVMASTAFTSLATRLEETFYPPKK